MWLRCLDFEEGEGVGDIVNVVSILSVLSCQTNRYLQSLTLKTNKSSKLINFRQMETRTSHRSGLEMLSHLKTKMYHQKHICRALI